MLIYFYKFRNCSIKFRNYEILRNFILLYWKVFRNNSEIKVLNFEIHAYKAIKKDAKIH